MRRWTQPLPAEPDRAILSNVWTTSTCYKPLEIERTILCSRVTLYRSNEVTNAYSRSLFFAPKLTAGTPGQVTGTVLATVVAVDTLTNRVKVQTQAGQVIELDTSTKDRQIGEQVTLIIPR